MAFHQDTVVGAVFKDFGRGELLIIATMEEYRGVQDDRRA